MRSLPEIKSDNARKVAVTLAATRERSHQINFRAGDEEAEAFRGAAEEAGLTLTDWCRLQARIGAGLTKGLGRPR